MAILCGDNSDIILKKKDSYRQTQNTKINAIFVHVKTAYCFHRLAYLGLKLFPKINIICDLEHVDARF